MQPSLPGEDGSLWGWLRSWRYFFAFLGLVLLIALFYAEENWRGQRAWESYVAQIQARGERIDPLAFVPPPVPRSENFAMTPLLAPLFGFNPGTQKWRTTNAFAGANNFAPGFDAAEKVVKSTKAVRSNSWIKAGTDLAAWHRAFLSQPPAGRTNFPPGREETEAAAETPEEAAAGVLAGLAECEPAIEEIRAASRLRYSRFEIRYEEEIKASILLPHLAVLKHFSQVLQLRASAELALGRTEEAANDILLMLYLADACRDEPIIVSHLVRMAQLHLAIQPLAEGLGQWSEPQLKTFQERLRRFDFCKDIRHSLAAERSFFGCDMIDYLRRNPDKINEVSGAGSGTGLPGVLLGAVPGGWFDFEKLNFSRMFDDYLIPGQDRRNPRVSPSVCRQVEERNTALLAKPAPILVLRHRIFCSFMGPGFSGALRKAAFAQAGVDTAAIACALERYRLAQGQFPESLEALREQQEKPVGGGQLAALMDELPSDVITGLPLKYRRTEDGRYVLYSVGWNEKDDGGIIVGKGAEGDVPRDVPREGDWVWRP